MQASMQLHEQQILISG